MFLFKIFSNFFCCLKFLNFYCPFKFQGPLKARYQVHLPSSPTTKNSRHLRSEGGEIFMLSDNCSRKTLNRTRYGTKIVFRCIVLDLAVTNF